MTTHTHVLEIRVDRKGTVEISGLSRGENEAVHLADELGFTSYEPVNFLYTAIRIPPLDPEALSVLREKAATLGYHLIDVEDLGAAHPAPPRPGGPGIPAMEEASTISVLHEHALTPSRKMKLVLPLVFAGVLVVLIGIGGAIRDHLTKSYVRVADFDQVIERAARPPVRQGFLGGLLNPDDSRYASVTVVAWPHWEGKSAVVGGSYIRVPGLRERSLEDLVKGDRGAAALTFQLDLSRTVGNRYHVDRILRDAQATPDVDLDMEIFPITTGAAPPVTITAGGSGYFDGAGLSYDRDNSFKGVKDVAVKGFVVKGADGYRLQTGTYAMAVATPKAPAVAALLEDLAADPAVVEAALAGKLPTDQKLALNHKRVVWFGSMGETFPWSEAGKPARRQLTREIGVMNLDGVQLGKLYLRNT